MDLKTVWHEKNLKKSILKNEIHLLKRCEMQLFLGKYRYWGDLPSWAGKRSTFWRLWQGGLSVPIGQFFLPSIFRMCLLYRKNAQKHKKNFMLSEFILVPIVNPWAFMLWGSTCIWNSEMNWWQNRINREPNPLLRHIGKPSQGIFVHRGKIFS